MSDKKLAVTRDEIAACIENFLNEEKFHFSRDDKGNFRFGVAIDSKLKSIKYVVDPKKDSYLVYAFCPLEGDTDDAAQMLRLAEYFTRCNYGVLNGNFEMDFRDGEIRYKIYVNCDGQLPCKQIVKDSIFLPSMMFERYGQGILDIMFRDYEPEQAIKHSREVNEKMIKEKILGTAKKSGGDKKGFVGGMLESLGIHGKKSDEPAQTDVEDVANFDLFADEEA